MAKVEATMESYRRVRVSPRQDYSKKGSYSQPSWKPPPEGWLKMNVDVDVRSKDQYVRQGIAIRNHKG